MLYNKYEKIASKFDFNDTDKNLTRNFDILNPACQNFWNCYAVPFLSFDKGLLFNNDVAVQICIIMITTSKLFICWRIPTEVKIQTKKSDSLYLVDSSLAGHGYEIRNEYDEKKKMIQAHFTLTNFLKMVHEINLSCILREK